MQYRPQPEDEHLWNATDLKDHLLTLVQPVYAQQILENPKKHSVLRKTLRLLTENGGIAAQIADHIWTGNKLKPFERSLAAQFWANRLWTLDRQRTCLGTTAIPDAACPYCHEEVESADHVANRCNLREVIGLIKRRHDDAVAKILAAVQAGEHGSMTIKWDARNISDLPGDNMQQGVKLPAWVLSRALQHSYPDQSLISAKPTAGRYGEHVATDKKHRSWIRILELKYAPDLEIHRARGRAMAQHDRLRESLLAAGWGQVTTHPVIIGNAGTITAETLTAFEKLGIDNASAITLAKNIAISSIRHTAKIKRARLSHGAGRPQDAEQASGSGPRAGPNPGQSTAHGQQPSTVGTAGADPLANEHPPQDPSGEASAPSVDDAMLPMALSDAACAPARIASPALLPEPDQWQTVVKRKRTKGTPQPVIALAATEPVTCPRPNRACKRPRGSYAILADLDEEEPVPPTVVRGHKRDRQQALAPTVPAALADASVQPAATELSTSKPDEAPTIPPLCPGDIPSTAPPALAYEQCADAQPATTATAGRRRKMLKAAQATDIVCTIDTEQQLADRNTQPSRRKRKAVSQQMLQLADQAGQHTPAAQVASQPDEASIIPLLCSSDNLMIPSCTAACAPCADTQPAASATTSRKQKKLKTAQAAATSEAIVPEQQPSVEPAQPSREKLLLSRNYSQKGAAGDSAFAHGFLIPRIRQQLLAMFSSKASAQICSPACHSIQGELPCLG